MIKAFPLTPPLPSDRHLCVCHLCYYSGRCDIGVCRRRGRNTLCTHLIAKETLRVMYIFGSKVLPITRSGSVWVEVLASHRRFVSFMLLHIMYFMVLFEATDYSATSHSQIAHVYPPPTATTTTRQIDGVNIPRELQVLLFTSTWN